MQRVTHGPALLHDTDASRAVERQALAGAAPGALMRGAGRAVARLAMAVAPHARTVWIACGPGNNGGDGFEAALQLRARGFDVHVSALPPNAGTPPDARAARERADAAGLRWTDTPPAQYDLAIDAMLGLGAMRAVDGAMASWVDRMNEGTAPVLAVDLPTGLDASTGQAAAPGARIVRATQVLSLLTLKPGLFTGLGRDHAGEVWFDDLGVAPDTLHATARLAACPQPTPRPHASHKGSHGDVAVVGGASGMSGAALLAARAALHAGAGRVFVGLLGPAEPVDPLQPELMLRDVESLVPSASTIVAGCGAGDAIRRVLPRLLSRARALVLDADGLNAIAADPMLAELLAARGRRGAPTVLTPHPLEAARLLGRDTAAVQADRIGAARTLAARYGATVVLKGSGSVIAAPGELPAINPTGNARLATAGTGDVLAGVIGARLASGQPAFAAACDAVFLHGLAADTWKQAGTPLTASGLAMALGAEALRRW